MAIQPHCDSCGKELTDYGAILLGPPDAQSNAKKFHLCQACYQRIVGTLKNIQFPMD